MTDEIVQDTLTMFGAVFQSKVMSALISDRPFMEQTFDIIEPSFFENNSRQWIVKTILEYYNQYRDLPTMAVFKVEINKIVDDVLKVSVVEQLKTVYQHISDKDLDYVKDKFL